jgi:guanylate kinase
MGKAKEHRYRYFPMVLSAPSGGGKTAIREKLLRLDERLRFNVTCTTRAKRPGEKDGRDYYFVTPEEFGRLRRSGKLLEWARVHGNLYGTPVRPVESLVRNGFIPVMTIDVKGARSVKKVFPGAVTVFLLPPDLNTLVKRLRSRGEPETGIKVRLETAKKELKAAASFDYLVINDRLDEAVNEIRKIAEAEAAGMPRRLPAIERFKKELADL